MAIAVKRNGGKWLGPGDQSEQYLREITERGYDILEDARDDVYSGENHGAKRPPKLWPASQAAAILGRSPGWLRDIDPENPIRNSSGHSAWSLNRLMAIAERTGLRFKRPKGVKPLVLACSKFKGGVGSTSIAATLSHGLAIKGLRVLAVDLDAQASLTAVLMGLIPDIHLAEEDLPNEALTHNPALIKDPKANIIKKTYFHNVHTICANSYLNRVEQYLSSALYSEKLGDDTGLSPAERLKAMLKYVEDDYDVILIDCPPTLGTLTTNALEAADGIISAVRPEAFDRTSLVSFFDTVHGHVELTGKQYDYIRILVSQSRDRLPGAGPDNARANFSEQREEDVREGHRRNEFKLRRDYGDAVMQSTMDWSPAFGHAFGKFNTVFSAPQKIGTRSTWDRGVSIAQSVVDEVYNDLRLIWDHYAEEQKEEVA